MEKKLKEGEAREAVVRDELSNLQTVLKIARALIGPNTSVVHKTLIVRLVSLYIYIYIYMAQPELEALWEQSETVPQHSELKELFSVKGI